MNFALILFLLTLLTGAVALLDRLVLARRRKTGVPEPWWIEYPKSFPGPADRVPITLVRRRAFQDSQFVDAADAGSW